MKKLLFISSLILLTFCVRAQRAANVWNFGNHASLDFTTAPPTVPPNSALFSSEGCASVSDSSTGALLFYTDGDIVYNANHVPMNGMPAGGIGGSNVAAQSSIIVKRPGNNNQYYIFTNPFYNPFGVGNFAYTIVNMNGNGGLGNIVSANNFLMQGTSERVSIINNCDKTSFWLISHEENGDGFYAWQVRNTGITGPIISNIGPALLPIGMIKFSPNRLKVAVTETSTETWLLDFDPTNGVFSNMIQLGVPGYAVEFSQNSRRLYVTQGDTSIVWQFDLSSNDAPTILASKTNISTSGDGFAWGIQHANDGKIYVAKNTEDSLDVINNPNGIGAACNFVANGLAVNPFSVELGLPNFPVDYVNPGEQRTYGKFRHNLCVGQDTARVEMKDLGRNPTWTYDFGDPASGVNNTLVTTNPLPFHQFSAQGTYTVKIVGTGPCATDSGTVVISTGEINLDAGVNQEICINDGTTITVNSNPAFQPLTYAWTPNSAISCTNCSNPFVNPTTNTSYIVTGSIGACTERDTVDIIVRPRPNLAVTPSDTIYCTPGISFQYTATGADTVRWNPPTGLSCIDCDNPVAAPINSVTYTVTGTNIYNCSITTTASVTIVPLVTNVVPLITDSFCITSNIFLAGNATGAGASFFWDMGDGTIKFGNATNHRYTQAGAYTIKFIAQDTLGCTDTIARNVFIDAKGTPFFEVSDSIICVGEMIYLNDSLHPFHKSFEYTIIGSNEIIRTRNPEYVFDKADIYQLQFTSKQLRCPDTSLTRVIKVNPIIAPDAGKDTSICPGSGAAIALSVQNLAGAGSYLWSDGKSSKSTLVATPGEYWVQYTDADSACVTSDTVMVLRDCFINIPNSFTPDGDGINDYFMQMNDFSKGVVSYSCEIFNRWGERVFNTTNLQSSGWDGKYGGIDQPMGTFVYHIVVVFNSGRKEDYTGNVTLLR